MSLYLVEVQYAVTEKAVIEVDTSQEAEAEVRRRLLIMEGDPRIISVQVSEVARIAHPNG